jgi:hypothetical protein
MRKDVLVYGLVGALLIALLQAVEVRWIIVEHSVEIYGGLVAVIFASAGLWLGLKLTRFDSFPDDFVTRWGAITRRSTQSYVPVIANRAVVSYSIRS